MVTIPFSSVTFLAAASAAAFATYEAQLKAETDAQNKVLATLKTAIAEKATASKQLLDLQQRLAAVSANKQPADGDFDAALKAVQEATAAVAEAAKPVAALTAKLKAIDATVQQKKKQVTAKTQLVADAKANVAAQQKIVEKAKADMATAAANLKAKEAEKKTADAAVKKAQDATKPQNKNYRTVTIPVRLHVHPTPGKIVAAVPNGGAFKKGAAADVKVTLTRKNNFAGPVKVSLVLPDGVKTISSNTVDIPADKTEATLTLTAAADAAAGDIAHAVIRATVADFNGRVAHFDAPVGLKIAE